MPNFITVTMSQPEWEMCDGDRDVSRLYAQKVRMGLCNAYVLYRTSANVRRIHRLFIG